MVTHLMRGKLLGLNFKSLNWSKFWVPLRIRLYDIRQRQTKFTTVTKLEDEKFLRVDHDRNSWDVPHGA